MRGFLSGWRISRRHSKTHGSWVGWLALLLWLGGCSRSTFPSPGEADRRMAEITSLQAAFRSPVPDRSGKYLAYVRAIGPGRRLFVYDLAAGVSQPVPTTNEVSQVFSWSPDHRYLAFDQAPPLVPRTDDPQTAAWLTLYDRQTGSVWRLGTNTDVLEDGAAWLAPHTLFYSVHNLGSNYTEKFILDLDAAATRKVRNYVSDFVLTGSNTAAYFKAGTLQTCRLDTTNYPPVQSLSAFPSNLFDLIRWLQYRSATGTFLFCGRATNSQWRCLYEFDPATQKLKQLTTRGTYNGQCLGAGYAYVGNISNEFYLALRPANPKLATNLFRGGNVITYAASADGGHVYAVASEGMEPVSLWDYDVARQNLRQLVSGQPQPWQSASLIEPGPRWTKSFDGLVVPYFVLKPAALTGNRHSPKKFPVVLYLPPASWQFQRAFDQPAEFFANLNCWYVAVNYRGGDGYGRKYGEMQSLPDAAHDVLVVLSKIKTNTNVDLQRIILVSESNGSDVLLELLKNGTNHWRGAILLHPEMAGLEAGPPPACPPLLLIAGDLERSKNVLGEFTDTAAQAGIPAQLILQRNTGHDVWSTDQIRDELEAEWKFVRNWME